MVRRQIGRPTKPALQVLGNPGIKLLSYTECFSLVLNVTVNIKGS